MSDRDAIVDMDGQTGVKPRPWTNDPKPIEGPLGDAAVRAGSRAMPFANLVAERSRLEVNGLAKMTVEYETAGTTTRPGGIKSLPLPTIHHDVGWKDEDGKWVVRTRAEVDAVVRRDGPWPIEVSARRVGEAVDRQFLGLGEPFMKLVHGVCNFPNRRTRTYDPPDQTLLVDVVKTMVADLRGDRFYGPFTLLTGRDTDARLDIDGSGLHGPTVRDDVMAIDFDPNQRPDLQLISKIQSVRYADWPADRIALVQLTPDVIRCVDGLSLRLVEWGEGYKVVCIRVPQVRANHEGYCGIVVAETGEPSPVDFSGLGLKISKHPFQQYTIDAVDEPTVVKAV